MTFSTGNIAVWNLNTVCDPDRNGETELKK